MGRRRVGQAIMALGAVAIVAGLALGGYNLWDGYRAGMEADHAVQAITQYREELMPVVEFVPDPALDPDREMPVLEVDGRRYIGTLMIPAIDLELPVQDSWSLSLLKAAPCRYKGSVYRGDMIVCAHNYVSHFGRLGNLLPGDEVIFIDMEGTVFRYTVAEKETLAGTAVEQMESGVWDLTLFTCTFGGRTRTTVRCNALQNTTPS